MLTLDLGLALQLAATIMTFVTMWQMGNRSIVGPIWGLASQVVWAAMVIANGLWGLAPTVVVLAFIHARNLRKWRREAA